MRVIDCEQNTDEWFEARAGRPTASEFSRIVTATGRRSDRWDDYMVDLVAESFDPATRFGGTYWTRRGSELEPMAREAFEASRLRSEGESLERPGFIVRDGCICGCSPDGIILDTNGEPRAGLEIKCLSPTEHARVVLSGEIKPGHKAQVHGGMAVTGLLSWEVWYWHPAMRPLHVTVLPNGFTGKLTELLDEFVSEFRGKRKELVERLKA